MGLIREVYANDLTSVG